MAIVDDRTWQCVEPFFPAPKPRRARCPGRLPIDNRKTLNGILFVLKTGIPWETLPVELGFGSGVTCWRRLREWRQSGVWGKLLPFLLTQLEEGEVYNWGRVQVTRNTTKQRTGRLHQVRRRKLRQARRLRIASKQTKPMEARKTA